MNVYFVFFCQLIKKRSPVNLFSDVSLQGRIKSLQKELASIKRVLNNVTSQIFDIVKHYSEKAQVNMHIFMSAHSHVHE